MGMVVFLYGKVVPNSRIIFVSLSEGLAVGVGFGAVEKTASATFESAR
jgi:hypothetical protein